MFRERGFDVEAVPFMRARDREFMAVKCWPAQDVAEVVEMLADPRNRVLEVQRIHIGRETYPGQPPMARVYVRWAS
jgi:hypothetical protein